MVATDLKSREGFIWELERSNLLEHDRREAAIARFSEESPDGDAAAMGEYFVRESLLTPYQVDRLLAGKSEGLVLGPYYVVEVLGAGSMGTVYKAISKTNNQWYAVKVLPRRSIWNIRLAHRK